MKTEDNTPKNTDEYISMFPLNTQELLIELRNTIRKAAPGAEETISYQMPAFKYYGILVYFAAYSKHIGFYPTGSGIEAFKNEITGYKCSKGTIQFPLDKPLPVDLITEIVKFRAEKNLEMATLKKKKILK